MAYSLHLAALVAGLAADAAVQVLAQRRRHPPGWVASFAGGFVAGLALFLALEIALALSGRQSIPEFTGCLLAASLAYGCCGFVYFNVVNGGKSALRVRLLAELEEEPAGLTAPELLLSYPPGEMFDTRLRRMRGHAQVILCDGRYRVGGRALLAIARLVTAAKVVVIGKRSEFA